MSYEDDYKLLEENGWIVECQSPFEIRKEMTGDFASGEAAYIVLEYVKEEVKEEEEYQNRIMVTKEALQDSLAFHKDKLLSFPTDPDSSIYKCTQSRIHLLEQQLKSLE